MEGGKGPSALHGAPGLGRASSAGKPFSLKCAGVRGPAILGEPAAPLHGQVPPGHDQGLLGMINSAKLLTAAETLAATPPPKAGGTATGPIFRIVALEINYSGGRVYAGGRP